MLHRQLAATRPVPVAPRPAYVTATGSGAGGLLESLRRAWGRALRSAAMNVPAGTVKRGRV